MTATSAVRKKGTPRREVTYRGCRRNLARAQARTARPATAYRQWWRPWSGIAPTGYADPTVRMPVRTPKEPSKTYPKGWRTPAERAAGAQRNAQPTTAMVVSG